MRRTIRSSSQVLLLALLCLTLGVAQGWAQAPVAAAPTAPAVLAIPAATATATASLPDLSAIFTPAPVAASTSCTTTAQCPTGQLCCLACGFAGCEARACFPPMHGHCPLFP